MAGWPASFSLSLLLLASAAVHAQTPASPPAPPAPPASPQVRSVTGFVPPFEIIRTVREAGFQPLVRPLREGSSYVLRATDYRGILMRVVLDARTGTIRDVTRIVPASGDDVGMVSPYGPPPGYAEPAYAEPVGLPPPAAHPAPAAVSHAATATRKPALPLPRPRPASLAAPKSAMPVNGTNAQPKADLGTNLNVGSNPVPAAPNKATPSLPFND